MKNGYYLACPKCSTPLELIGENQRKIWAEYTFECPNCKSRFIRKVEYKENSTQAVRDALKPLALKQ